MKARIVRIGNSRGLRLPKSLLAQLGLTDEVEMQAEDGALVIRPANRVRTGWADAAARLAETGKGLLDEPAPTRFDDEEWQWR